MIIQENTHKKIINSFTPFIPEIGGILGGNDRIIYKFELDKGLGYERNFCYYPNPRRLNNILTEWCKNGIEFYGIIHSHPHNQYTLSNGDLRYISTILEYMPKSIPWLYFPLILDSKEIISFKACITSKKLVINRDKVYIKYQNGG